MADYTTLLPDSDLTGDSALDDISRNECSETRTTFLKHVDCEYETASYDANTVEGLVMGAAAIPYGISKVLVYAAALGAEKIAEIPQGIYRGVTSNGGSSFLDSSSAKIKTLSRKQFVALGLAGFVAFSELCCGAVSGVVYGMSESAYNGVLRMKGINPARYDNLGAIFGELDFPHNVRYVFKADSFIDSDDDGIVDTVEDNILQTRDEDPDSDSDGVMDNIDKFPRDPSRN